MIGIQLRAVSNAEVVDNQAESNIKSFVLKETESVGALVVAMFGEVRDESKLAQTTSLREAVHVFRIWKYTAPLWKRGSKFRAAIDAGGIFLRSMRMYS